ncbi:MAG: N-acetylmuramoyl-L-alanine amidase [Eubacteriales bacterium]|nr:N-acetylmuramoyl-L-alanine amidase [Eubacteriales bacterium]
MAKQRGRRKKKSVGVTIWMLLCTGIVLLCAAGIMVTIYGQDAEKTEGDTPDVIAGISVHTDYISEDSIARPGRTRNVHYIVIHETDNTASHANAAAHNTYLHENCWKEQKSWHYTVDDTEIWHHLPNNEVGYHAGDTSWKEGGNRNGIGIELCVNQGGNFDRTMQNAAQLTAYLLRQYGLDIDAVKKHQDFSGKICPSTIIRENRWEEFQEMVQTAYAEQEVQAAADAAKENE